MAPVRETGSTSAVQEARSLPRRSAMSWTEARTSRAGAVVPAQTARIRAHAWDPTAPVTDLAVDNRPTS